MKKVISVLAVLAMATVGAGSALAWTTQSASWNTQNQAQNLVSIPSVGASQLSQATQKQEGIGGSVSVWGSDASEEQFQVEGIHTSVVSGMPNNWSVHTYNMDSATSGGSDTGGWYGVAGHAEQQRLTSTILTLDDTNGTFGLAGMSTTSEQSAVADTGWWYSDSSANASAENIYENSYESVNIGSNSFVHQYGSQAGRNIVTASDNGGWWYSGNASAYTASNQTGGTLAVNDGNATQMAGMGAAKGTATVDASYSWYGDASATVEQNQVHTYEQGAVQNIGTGGMYQYATGTVRTSNYASE